MDVRDIKLAIACGVESEEIKSLNVFFDELFNDIYINSEYDMNYLFFMKGDVCIMKQHLKIGALFCIYDNFWKVLRTKFEYTIQETQEIIHYKVKENFNIESLTSNNIFSLTTDDMQIS